MHETKVNFLKTPWPDWNYALSMHIKVSALSNPWKHLLIAKEHFLLKLGNAAHIQKEPQALRSSTWKLVLPGLEAE